MNIFDIYLEKIIKIISEEGKKSSLKIPDYLNSINVGIPPQKFDCDISTNVAMVLSKINQKNPMELAQFLSVLIKSKEKSIDKISVEKPSPSSSISN